MPPLIAKSSATSRAGNDRRTFLGPRYGLVVGASFRARQSALLTESALGRFNDPLAGPEKPAYNSEDGVMLSDPGSRPSAVA